MKKIFFLVITVIITVILISCAGLPKPIEDSDSLITGNFLLDFPDGFFNRPPITIGHGVTLNFINVNTKKGFSVKTADDGYFRFLSNGRDDYLFLSFEYSKESGSHGRYTLSEAPIERKITNSPHKIIYIGHFIYTYAQVERGKTTSKGRGETKYYKYEQSISVESNKKALLEYLQNKQPDSPWLNYEIEDRF